MLRYRGMPSPRDEIRALERRVAVLERARTAARSNTADLDAVVDAILEHGVTDRQRAAITVALADTDTLDEPF